MVGDLPGIGWYAGTIVVRTLVLNASNEPLSVVAARRAIVLLYRERADLVARSNRVWHAESASFAVPSVVRLRRYVPVPYKRSIPISRRAIFLRDDHRCQYCGRRAENIDHVIPKVQGGKHIWENVVASCQRCNSRKGGRTPLQAGLTLIRTPVRPGRFDWVYVAAGGYADGTWQPFVGEQLSAARTT
ncbi:HNH endonuclease family protein [hydrothermal vent metagenome]|uniref:HNH endonuclease family protein n=1 Tax=hydrothermal vent metagenome TaxID=652676 RepID=A0A3B0STZ2_9ZZZZ